MNKATQKSDSKKKHLEVKMKAISPLNFSDDILTFVNNQISKSFQTDSRLPFLY